MAAFAFDRPRRRRRGSLAPMIDVVFLLLIFFILAARFGTEGTLAIAAAGEGGAAWEGPPRLVEIAPDGIRLNGRTIALEALGPAARALAPSPDSPVVVRPLPGADVQALTDALDALAAAGLSAPVLAE
jgi:biopolymer transport protein ExbD